MAKLRRIVWHRLTRRELGVLSALAAADGVLLVAIAYGLTRRAAELALSLIPSYSAMFLVLVATLACFAERRRVSWWLVIAVAFGGPVAAGAGLHCAGRWSSPPKP